MKRRFDTVPERDSATPRPSPAKALYPLSGRSNKRQRSLRSLVSTPSVATPQVPTPDSVRARQACYEPSTAERKLAGFSLDSPILGVTQVTQSKLGRKSELSRFSQVSTDVLALQHSPCPSFGVGLADTCDEDEDDDDDGYFIRSSQSYSRLSSQVCNPCNTPTEQIKVNLLAQDSQETQQSHFSFPSSQHPSTQPSQPNSNEPGFAPPQPLGPAVATAAAAAAHTTPELNDSTTITSVADEGGTHLNEEECSAAKLFPIFRPRDERKIVLIIRHGESEYNKAADGRNLADPNIFDPKLTVAGHRQAQALKAQLQEYIKKHGEALWLMSPLTRCIQTFIDACPCLDQAHPAPGPSSRKPGLNIQVLSSISEHVNTPGDVGRPASELVKDFPMLSNELRQLNDCWWLTHHDKPNCAINKIFTTRESKDQLKRRVAAFSSWLSRRPEKLVIAFGHSTFWKEFTNSQSRMKNGELKAMRW